MVRFGLGYKTEVEVPNPDPDPRPKPNLDPLQNPDSDLIAETLPPSVSKPDPTPVPNLTLVLKLYLNPDHETRPQSHPKS